MDLSCLHGPVAQFWHDFQLVYLTDHKDSGVFSLLAPQWQADADGSGGGTFSLCHPHDKNNHHYSKNASSMFPNIQALKH
jgi:hypothetical protein